MNVNFYYEQPVPWNGGIHCLIGETLFEYYRTQFPDIKFTKVDLRITDTAMPEEKYKIKLTYNPYSYHCVIIENDESKKYFLISIMDKLSFTDNWDTENCVEIFPTSGAHKDCITYLSLDMRYTPFTTQHIDLQCEIECEELYKLNLPKITPGKPYFRSTFPYHFREYIRDDNRFDATHEERVLPSKFIERMSKESISIDINGAAEISNRTVLAMCLGNALIRPKLVIKYHNDLIPDFHYAAVKCDDLSNYKELADAYIDRFEELKKDKDLVHYLSINGRKWYEENATFESNIKICKELINFKKII